MVVVVVVVVVDRVLVGVGGDEVSNSFFFLFFLSIDISFVKTVDLQTRTNILLCDEFFRVECLPYQPQHNPIPLFCN